MFCSSLLFYTTGGTILIFLPVITQKERESRSLNYSIQHKSEETFCSMVKSGVRNKTIPHEINFNRNANSQKSLSAVSKIRFLNIVSVFPQCINYRIVQTFISQEIHNYYATAKRVSFLRFS